MKYNLFSFDSPFMQFMNRIGRNIILNLLFVVTCIPIVTIGAASTAMYTVTLKQAKNEEPYIASTYFKAFKENFRQSTILWIIWMFGIALLYVDFRALMGRDTFIANVMRIMLIIVIILAYMMLSYTFPLQATFYNSVRHTLQNSFFISIQQIKKTIPILIIPVAGIAITLISYFALYFGVLLWLFLGFATCAQLKSKYFVEAFDFYINPPQEEPAEEEDEEYSDEADYEEAPAEDIWKTLANAESSEETVSASASTDASEEITVDFPLNVPDDMELNSEESSVEESESETPAEEYTSEDPSDEIPDSAEVLEQLKRFKRFHKDSK